MRKNRMHSCAMVVALGAVPHLASALIISNGYSSAVCDRFSSGFATAPVANNNPSFLGAGLDLSGVCWSLSDPTHAAALLSPVQILESQHDPMLVNSAGDLTPTLAFEAPGSTALTTAFVQSSIAVASTISTDLQIGTLGKSMPANIGVYSVLDQGASASYVGDPLLIYGLGASSPEIGQNTVAGTFSGTNGNQLFFNTSGSQPQLATPEPGDSQSPLFIPWANPVTGQNQLTIIGAQWTTAYSTFLGDSTREAAIDALMTPTGYALRWTPAQIDTTWQGGISNNWGTAANWSAGVPATTAYILFDPNTAALASSRMINLAANRTVVGIYFKAGPAGRPFTLSAGSVLTIGRGGIVNYDSALETINATIVFNDNQNWFAGAGGLAVTGTLINNGDLLYWNTNGNSTLSGLITGSGGLAKDGTGMLTVSASQLYLGPTFVHAGILNVAHPTGIAAGTVTIDPGATLRYSQPSSQAASITSLTMGVGSTLDVNSTVAIGTASPTARDALFAQLKTSLITGRAGGAWNGTGLTSSLAQSQNAAAGKGIYALALVRDSDLNYMFNTTTHLFGGLAVTPWWVLMKYTYAGDTDLDGRITEDDYLNIDTSLLEHKPAMWSTGDFNYDGTVNFADYALMDSAYLAQSGTLALPMIQEHAAEFGEPYLEAMGMVPEPGTLGMMLVGAGMLMRRRRGKK